MVGASTRRPVSQRRFVTRDSPDAGRDHSSLFRQAGPMLGQLLINGIATGAIYSLLAVGFVIIYNTTRMLHIAHGTVYTFGAYAYYVLAVVLGMGLWLSIP